jgi:hypothetical protein
VTNNDSELFVMGDKVAVRPNCGWPDLPTGRIVPVPEAVKSISKGWNVYSRRHYARGQYRRSYWVEFDIPQFDADGDGPSPGAEIDERSLMVVNRGD